MGVRGREIEREVCGGMEGGRVSGGEREKVTVSGDGGEYVWRGWVHTHWSHISITTD